MTNDVKIKVIGAGLAGCEAAFQAAKLGVNVELYEMEPAKFSPAHHNPGFAELVCSNSLRSNQLNNAVGLLKAELSKMDLTQLAKWIEDLNDKLDDRKKAIASEILREIETRIKFLLDVGVGYLNLGRSSRSLSGGESQRIRLATQIGSELVNVLYILDEPSIGLHQSDNIRLIKALKRLRDAGNSVIVVVHDKDRMKQSDFVVDIAPGAGVNGGNRTAL